MRGIFVDDESVVCLWGALWLRVRGLPQDVDVTLSDRAKRGLSKTGEAISDTWINTKVSWFFVGEDVLDDSNINVDTDAGVVTLKGTVLSEAGRTRALALARRTEGVKDVRDQLTIAPAR